MDERTRDTIDKSEELRRLLEAGDAAQHLAAVGRAELALEFRDMDPMIGLPAVDANLVEGLRGLVVQALEKAVRLGSADARFRLSDALAAQGDAEGAVDPLVPLAEAGDAKAAGRAAEIVWAAQVEGRYVEAARWLHAASPADETGKVHYMKALFAFHGLGREKDLSEAITLHEQAAARGYADAMFELYAMHWQGVGCQADLAKAAEWCVKAAEAGSVRAMANLGSFHATGRGLPKDPGKAVEWYARAAENGHGQAAATLGCMYAMGQEIEEDEEKARGYFRRARELGFDWRPMAEAVGLDPAEWE